MSKQTDLYAVSLGQKAKFINTLQYYSYSGATFIKKAETKNILLLCSLELTEFTISSNALVIKQTKSQEPFPIPYQQQDNKLFK